MIFAINLTTKTLENGTKGFSKHVKLFKLLYN